VRRGTIRLALIPIFLALVPLSGNASTRPSQGGPWEANITHYHDGQDGEPSVAVNPTDPKNVIVTYLETGGAAGALVYQQRVPRVQDEVIQTIQSCRYVVTHDGGKTWRMKFIPTTDLVMPNCSDTYVLFDKHGVAYIMAGNFNVAFPILDETRVVTSVDGGETWSAPATALRNTTNPGAQPLEDAADAQIKEYIDRYWIAIDDSTGAIYITAVQTWIPPVGSATRIGPIVSSRDGGRTWSKPTLAAPVGSPHVAAAHGKVAVTYNDPDCTCVVFAISSNDGKTFTRKATRFTSDGSPQVVADQTRPGRFAVMTSAGPNLLSRVTNDGGATWSKPITISQPGSAEKFKPWIAYSRHGVLGAGWRTQYADDTYDFWAAASTNGGTSWAHARRISTQRSQPQNPIWVGGDDTSDVQFGPDDTLYAAWGDWRTGDLDIFWGGFPTTTS
jgi:hypothetical protein